MAIQDTVHLMILLLIGLVLVWYSDYLKLQLGEVSKGVLLILHALFYLLAAGKLTELEGLGIKINAVKQTSVIKAARAADLMIHEQLKGIPNYVNEANLVAGILPAKHLAC